LGVAKRMGKVAVWDEDHTYILRHEERWHERFIEHLKRFYFTSKLHGVAPRYYELDEAETKEREEIVQKAKTKRAAMAEKVKLEAIETEKRLQIVYNQDLRQKIRRAESHTIEREKRAAHVGGCSTETLMEEVGRRVKLQEESARNIERKREEGARREMRRLQDYVKSTLLETDAGAGAENLNEGKEEEMGEEMEGGVGEEMGEQQQQQKQKQKQQKQQKEQRSLPIEIVPCWKSKPLNSESLPDRRKGALSFKAKFSKRERNYDPTATKGGKTTQDRRAIENL